MADKDLGTAEKAAKVQGITERAIRLMGDLGFDVSDSQNAERLRAVTEALRATANASHFLTLKLVRALCSDEDYEAMFAALLATEAGGGE